MSLASQPQAANPHPTYIVDSAKIQVIIRFLFLPIVKRGDRWVDVPRKAGRGGGDDLIQRAYLTTATRTSLDSRLTAWPVVYGIFVSLRQQQY